VVAAARDLSARSFGPATAKYRELGTVANLLAFNRLNALPTRNFQQGQFVGAELVSGEALNETSDSSPVVLAAAEDSDEVAWLSLPDSVPPQAASAGTRRTAHRAATGRCMRRDTDEALWSRTGTVTVAIDPERNLCLPWPQPSIPFAYPA
jgi:hypothetical protein